MQLWSELLPPEPRRSGERRSLLPSRLPYHDLRSCIRTLTEGLRSRLVSCDHPVLMNQLAQTVGSSEVR